MTAADYQAVAEWVGALAALIGVGVLGWAKGLPAALTSWSRVRMRRATSLLFSREVAALPSTEFNPEVSLEAGIAYARQAARSGHPPYTVTQGRVSAGQPLGYLLGEVRNGLGGRLISSVGTGTVPGSPPTTTWALLPQKRAGPRRVTLPWASSPSGRGRKKYGWPDQPGTEQERAGRRQAHGWRVQ